MTTPKLSEKDTNRAIDYVATTVKNPILAACAIAEQFAEVRAEERASVVADIVAWLRDRMTKYPGELTATTLEGVEQGKWER